VEFAPHLHGGIKGRSVVTNAKPHLNREVVINLDLSNFFGTITAAKVRKVFKDHLGCSPEVAKILAALTTLNNQLPQGAPTSPALANLAALPVDAALMRLCSAKLGKGAFGYSRYIDDITISGGKEAVELLDEIGNIVERCGFTLNGNKTKVLRRSSRQCVTGIVVNKKLNTPRKLVRRLRQDLYYCGKFGIKAHGEWHGTSEKSMLQRVYGRLAYFRMVQPDWADKLFYDFRGLVPQVVTTKLETKLITLKRAIAEEFTVDFIYENNSCRAAPTEISMDRKGFLRVKAYQTVPIQGWTTYHLERIRRLKEFRHHN
jgi:hypothetical protein